MSSLEPERVMIDPIHGLLLLGWQPLSALGRACELLRPGTA